MSAPGEAIAAAPLQGLKRRRKAERISQARAGEWIGVTKQHFAKLESGTTRLDVFRARILAERLSCPMESLF